MAAFTFPASPSPNQEVTGPGGVVYKWDNVRWNQLSNLNFAPLNNPSGGQFNYSPLANPNFTGTVSIGGTALGGLFAPLTNPANGQNNYLPIANPAFTGTLTAPTGGSWSATGIVNVPTLGIGTGVPTATTPVVITGNVNSDSLGIAITNQNGGIHSAAAMFVINNVGRTLGFYMTGSAFVQVANWAPPNAGQIVCSGPLSIATTNDVTNDDPIRLFVGAHLQARFDQDGFFHPTLYRPTAIGAGVWVMQGGIGCWDYTPGTDDKCNIWFCNDAPSGWASITAQSNTGSAALSCMGNAAGAWANRALLYSDSPGGLWIQTWQASPAGGIHFAIGKVEYLHIEEDGVHVEEPIFLSGTWQDDNAAVTLNDSAQAGFDVAAGGEVMLGAGAGLLMVTATSEPQSTALFLLGNQSARLISNTSGDGWTDGYPPAPQGKLLVFWRDGKYRVSNGRVETVHLNDMMFKNAEN